MLAIIDCGMGNLRSVYMAFRRLGVEAQITSDAGTIGQAQAVALPGVGAFGDAMERLRALHLVGPIHKIASAGTPLIGICLGLQLLFESSEELGNHRGLGLLRGRVTRFPEGLPVPHMGWNQIHQARPIPLWQGVPDHAYAYFVHSYYVEPADSAVIAATTDYGIEYVSAVTRDNLCGIQFHPEKSQDVGERILRNWLMACGLLPPDAAWEGA